MMVDGDKHKPEFDRRYPVSEVRDPLRPGRPRRVVTEKTTVIKKRKKHPVGRPQKIERRAEPEIEVPITNKDEKRYCEKLRR